jgi:hypothetical protein
MQANKMGDLCDTYSWWRCLNENVSSIVAIDAELWNIFFSKVRKDFHKRLSELWEEKRSSVFDIGLHQWIQHMYHVAMVECPTDCVDD